MNVSTSAPSVTYGGYSGLASPSAGQLGGAIGAQAGGIATGVYGLTQAKTSIDYEMASLDLLTGVYAGSALSPYLQAGQLILQGSLALHGYLAKETKRKALKRAERIITALSEAETVKGHAPGVAASIALGNLVGWGTTSGKHLAYEVAQAGYSALRGSPFVQEVKIPIAGSLRTRSQFRLIDPDTGEPATERDLLERYGQGPAFARELATRIAPGQGQVPPLLTRRIYS